MARTQKSTTATRKTLHGAPSERAGAPWTRCRPDCVRPTPSQAHCSVCHETFGGVSGFDAHRRDGQCRNPADLGMARGDSGVWRVPMDDATKTRRFGRRDSEAGGDETGNDHA